MKRLRWVAIAMVLSFPAAAEVVYSAPGGFEIRIEANVPVPPSVAYDQFLAVGQWWNASHTWFGKSEGLHIEPHAGGCFCETSGDRSALHMLVSFVDPGKEVRLVGGLGPLQGLGLHGAMSWSFEGVSDKEAKVIHVYRVTGYHPDGLEGLASVVDAVQTIQVKGLATRLGGSLVSSH